MYINISYYIQISALDAAKLTPKACLSVRPWSSTLPILGATTDLLFPALCLPILHPSPTPHPPFYRCLSAEQSQLVRNADSETRTGRAGRDGMRAGTAAPPTPPSARQGIRHSGTALSEAPSIGSLVESLRELWSGSAERATRGTALGSRERFLGLRALHHAQRAAAAPAKARRPRLRAP